jgi:glycosyltransferase involved in cell wall biosynthesis
MWMSDEPAGTATVIVPAHNESSVIGRCLSTLLATAHDDEFDVVVVCNGCTDSTADIARTYAGVRVLQIDQASKIAALNAGDKSARAYPRIYLDADVELSTDSARRVVATLNDGAAAAAPLPVVDTTRASWASRAYFSVWSRLGYATTHVLGSGVYALSKGGRDRFAAFPNVIADDGYVYSQFAPDERANPPGATFTIRAPRHIRAAIRRRIRIAAGNKQLQEAGLTMRVPGPSWRQVVRRERRLLPALVVYLSANAIAEIAARRRVRRGMSGSWHQDPTTRT